MRIKKFFFKLNRLLKLKITLWRVTLLKKQVFISKNYFFNHLNICIRFKIFIMQNILKFPLIVIKRSASNTANW